MSEVCSILMPQRGYWLPKWERAEFWRDTLNFGQQVNGARHSKDRWYHGGTSNVTVSLRAK